jgi:hypothetical protein
MNKFLERISWSILPLLIMTLLGVFILHGAHDYNLMSLVALGVFLFGAALPVFSAFCNNARIAVMKKRARQGSISASYEIRRLEAKFSKYFKAFMLTWIAGAITAAAIGLSIVFFSGHLTQYPQPASLSPGSDTYALLQILHGAESIAKIFAIFSLPSVGILFLVSLFKKTPRANKPIKILIVTIAIIFALSSIFIFMTGYISAGIIRGKVRNYLQDVTVNAQIYIDDKTVNNSAEILTAIRKFAPYAAHHSHDEGRFELHILDSGQHLTLQLGRDNRRPNEYWVFYPDMGRDGIEIGRITTNIFDK